MVQKQGLKSGLKYGGKRPINGQLTVNYTYWNNTIDIGIIRGISSTNCANSAINVQ